MSRLNRDMQLEIFNQSLFESKNPTSPCFYYIENTVSKYEPLLLAMFKLQNDLLLLNLEMSNFYSLICSTKEIHEVWDTDNSSNSIVQLNISDFNDKHDTSRKIKVEEEKERCKQIIQGFTMLKEQLLPTCYKMSNAELLKKVLKNKEEKNLHNKLLQLNSICTKLNSELEYFKKMNENKEEVIKLKYFKK
ncbi:9797_t:CDS:2 [Gigaspora margarita]|uniref:9797_t:CDS:1 n=1 Tax=Gigaspora margarita TaxID=4874 RepID=A0ABN7VTR5_GIGMA|nr:9797_t:CDS:2 [Gigaspora margarita]